MSENITATESWRM